MTTVFNSFRYAVNGIAYFFRTQMNARIHLVALLFVIILGFLLRVSLSEWLWLTVVSGLVFTAEAFNTSIEILVDLVSPEWNQKARKIKDVAAGAVLITAITALAVAFTIFLPKLIWLGILLINE